MDRSRLAPRRCRVTARQALAPSTASLAQFLTELEAPELASEVAPGQFVMVRQPDALDPLLGRPYSVYSTTEDGRFGILYDVIGRGTAALAAAEPGVEMSILGPLGRGFAIDPPPRQAVLVAGGIGIAGLHLLADRLRARDVPVTLLFGARSADGLGSAAMFSRLGVTLRTITDDGSDGNKGLVTALLEATLPDLDPARDAVFSCGPTPMMRRVREMCLDSSVPCQLALEAHMACGFGICLGCVVPSATEPGTYRLVCTDGPCMDAAEVVP